MEHLIMVIKEQFMDAQPIWFFKLMFFVQPRLINSFILPLKLNLEWTPWYLALDAYVLRRLLPNVRIILFKRVLVMKLIYLVNKSRLKVWHPFEDLVLVYNLLNNFGSFRGLEHGGLLLPEVRSIWDIDEPNQGVLDFILDALLGGLLLILGGIFFLFFFLINDETLLNCFLHF